MCGTEMMVVLEIIARAKETTVSVRMVFKVDVGNAAVEHFADFSRSALLRTLSRTGQW